MKKRKILLVLFVLCFCSGLYAQKTITGTVRDASKEALPGVTVNVKGSQRGTATDANGTYSINIQAGDKDLIFTYIGMKSRTVSIGNKTTVDVTMDDDMKMLNEVVITGLNISRPNRSLPSAQQRVDAGTIAEVRDANIVSSLAGKIAGVMITPPTSSTGSARIVIRGNSSFTGNNQPLFVVDGMQIDNSDGSNGVNKNGGLDMGNGASDINPDDIETIDVLKGPNAAALYGSRAANGVILITTKKAKEGRFKLSLASNTMMHYISQWPDFQNAFGVGHMTRMLGNGSQGSPNGRASNVFALTDENGNPYPYPGIPTMQGILLNVATRSNGGPQIGTPYIGLDGQIYTYSPQPDNVYGFYQKAWAYTNNVALEGGNKDNNYRLSLTNYNANDVVENQNLVDKNTLTLRFFNTLVKNLTLDSKMTLISDNTKNRRYANQSNYNPLYMYTVMPRTLTLDQLKNYKTADGKESVRVGDIHNPYWTMNETSNFDDKIRVLANFDLSYQILPSLKLNLKYGREYNQTKTQEFRNMGALSDDYNGKGFFKTQTNKYDNQMLEWQLLYNQRFDKISLLATVGGNRLDFKGWWQNSEIRQLKVPNLQSMQNYDDKSWVNADNGAESWKRINSLFGSFSIGYNDYLYLDITARNDWSSTLPLENCSYLYPSVGVSVIPTAMLNIPERVFFGKLRASYAEVGNDTNPYRLIPYYELSQDNTFLGYKFASLPGTLPKYDLKPERTRSIELGADFRFLNGRINADVTWYKKNSYDQIVDAAMASSSGYHRKIFNNGEIENKGIEIMLNTTPVETGIFTWNIDANFAKYTSKVVDMLDNNEIEIGEIFSLKNRVVEGYPYGAMFGTVWLTDQQGRRMVNPNNGEPVRKENVYLGNFNPDFMLGVSNRFRYRDFDLYVLVDIKKGGKLYSGTRRQGIRNGVISGLETAQESWWKRDIIFGDGGDNVWGGVQFNENGQSNITNQNIYYYDPTQYESMETMNPLDPNYVPEQCTRYFWPGNVGYYADGFDDLVIYDASFVKLREVSLGYTLPKKLISKIKMSNARISVVGRNLWILYQKTPKGLDPEAALNAGNGQGLESGSLPPNTTFGVDIKIAF
ncbi:MAG: SusC/RagA family TonB-linked outer membrane protein [Candidatus Symbiothrix sp.]|jgi:TonB-linked SusC/RagA family outer membrane protein|nr:SusC/RagA family TonB-linked outer membrane protein [Candidatus Symbiothrix sp.]